MISTKRLSLATDFWLNLHLLECFFIVTVLISNELFAEVWSLHFCFQLIVTDYNVGISDWVAVLLDLSTIAETLSHKIY